MPLFALISGFFLFKTLANNSYMITYFNKTRQLISPIIIVGIFYYIIYKDLDSAIESSVGGLWFLLAMYFATIVILLMKFLCRSLRGEIIFIVVIFVILPLIKHDSFTAIHKFMIIFSIIGYLSNKYKDSLISCRLFQQTFFFYSLGGALLIYLVSPYHYYLYGGFDYSKQNILLLFASVFCRTSFSLLISVFIMYVIFKLYRFTSILLYLKLLGRYTMGLYVIQTIIYDIIVSNNIYVCENYIVNTSVMFLLVLGLSSLLTISFSKFCIFRYFLLGLKWK